MPNRLLTSYSAADAWPAAITIPSAATEVSIASIVSPQSRLLRPCRSAELPPGVEMMQRSAPGTDVEAVCRSDCRADISLRLARRLIEREALGKARRNRRRKRATGTVGFPRLDPRRGES